MCVRSLDFLRESPDVPYLPVFALALSVPPGLATLPILGCAPETTVQPLGLCPLEDQCSSGLPACRHCSLCLSGSSYLARAPFHGCFEGSNLLSNSWISVHTPWGEAVQPHSACSWSLSAGLSSPCHSGSRLENTPFGLLFLPPPHHVCTPLSFQ